jgi:signal recognition particle receptor subunit beta
MTAALTVLTYGKKFQAKVEYFTSADLEIIKKEHDYYKERWDSVYSAKQEEIATRLKKRGESVSAEELEEKAKRQTKKEMEELDDASFDQYDRMVKSGCNPAEMCAKNTEIIDAQNLKELVALMNNYVGSDGKAMPFTKSVEIQLSGEEYKALENIRVVDTPGVNDPVRSREQRTEEYLNECDVVFIVSPAGRFMDKNSDMNLIDRLSGKEGVSELFIVASKADEGVLAASIVKESGSKLETAVDNVNSTLSKQAINALLSLKKASPEVAGQFDQLINDKERVMILSGMCHSMSLHFDEKNNWDEGFKHEWELLVKSYPENFSDDVKGKAALDLLANINTIKGKIEKTRAKKDQIMAKKQEDYLNQQAVNIIKYRDGLEKTVREKLDKLKTADVEQLKRKKAELQKQYAICSDGIDSVCEDCFDTFKRKVKDMAEKNAKQLISGTKSDAQDEKGTETIEVEKRGVLNWFARKITGGGYETKQIEVIRAGAVKSTLRQLSDDLRENLEKAIEEAKEAWKKEMPRRILMEYQTASANDANDNTDAVRAAIRNVINSFEIPEFNFSGIRPFSGPSGTLKNEKVDEFLGSVDKYLYATGQEYKKITEGTLQTIEENVLKKQKISGLIFEDMLKEITELEKQLTQKEDVMRRFEKCLQELKEAAEMDEKMDVLDNDPGRFHFISRALAAHPEKNGVVDQFSKIFAAFEAFAKEEDAMKEELSQIRKMESVRDKISLIANFPSIYGKRIGAVGGGFSAGKSSFLNNFLPENSIELVVGIEPVTAIPCYITCEKDVCITGHNAGGGMFEIKRETFKSISHEFLQALTFNLKELIPYITVSSPLNTELFENLCLIDTPGYDPAGSGSSEKDFDTAVESIKKADFLIWLIDIGSGTIPLSDIKFLNKLGKEKKFDLYIIANKADFKDEAEREDILDRIDDDSDELDMRCAGICAYSSAEKKEYRFRKQSVFEFIKGYNFANNKTFSEIEDTIEEVMDAYRDALIKQKKDYETNLKLIKNIKVEMFKSNIEEDNASVEANLKSLQAVFNTDKIPFFLDTVEVLRGNFKNCIQKLKVFEKTKDLNAEQIMNFLDTL